MHHLAQLGKDSAQAHHWKEAKNVVDRLESTTNKNTVLAELVRALTQAKLWEEAKNMILAIEDEFQKIEVLSDLICALGELQMWKQTKNACDELVIIINSIEDAEHRILAMTKLGKLLKQGKHWEQIRFILTKAKAMFRIIENWGMMDVELRKTPADATYWEREEITHFNDREVLKRVSVLIKLSKLLAQLQYLKQAKRVLTKAKNKIHTINDLKNKAEVLIELGEAYTWMQCLKKAEVAFSQARRIAETIEDTFEEGGILSEICKAWARTGQLNKAEAVAFTIKESGTIKHEALLEIAEMLHASGEEEHLLHLVQQAWLQAETIGYAVELILLATNLIPLKTEVGASFCNAFTWVDAFLKSE